MSHPHKNLIQAFPRIGNYATVSTIVIYLASSVMCDKHSVDV
jgi:hypothetical protein